MIGGNNPSMDGNICDTGTFEVWGHLPPPPRLPDPHPHLLVDAHPGAAGAVGLGRSGGSTAVGLDAEAEPGGQR